MFIGHALSQTMGDETNAKPIWQRQNFMDKTRQGIQKEKEDHTLNQGENQYNYNDRRFF